MYSMLAYGQGTRERERVEFWTYLGGIIITPRNSHIPPNLYTPHALRMASQSMQTSPPLDIPYAESVVAGAGDGDRPVGEDFDTADGGGMAGEGVDALAKKSCADQHVVGGGGGRSRGNVPGFDIPYFDLLITTARDYQTRFQPLPPSYATA